MNRRRDAMNRSPALLLLVVLLVGYAVYAASHVPALIVAPIVPMLLAAFLLQAVVALVAAIGTWNRQSWGPRAIVILGVIIAVTWLIEGFALGIVAYLYALSVALLALVLCVMAAAFITNRRQFV